MRVLVTGGAGFIGRWVLEPLVRAGHDVHATHTRESLPGPPAVQWHRIDLLDGSAPGLVRELAPEVMVHMAWYTAHGRFWHSAENLRWLAASAELLRAFGESGGRRFVGAGTCVEYDWSRVEGLCVEDNTPVGSSNLYGVTKDALRRVLQAYAARAGFEWTWGRIFFLYGPDEHPDRLVPSLARALKSGRAAEMSHGRQVRDFLHVEDVGAAFAHLALGDLLGVVNVGSGEGSRLADIGEKLAQMAGRPDLLRLGARAPQEGEPPSLIADVTRLRGSGFVPRWTLADGLRQLLAGVSQP